NVMIAMSDDIPVFCDDEKEMERLGVPDDEIPYMGGTTKKRRFPGGFFGALYVMEDYTREAEALALGSEERLFTAKDFESEKKAKEKAVSEREELAAEVLRQKEEIAKLRAESRKK